MPEAWIEAVVEREAQAWRLGSVEEYDREVCSILEEIDAVAELGRRRGALVALCAATAERNAPMASASRGGCAERLLGLIFGGDEPASRPAIQHLFLRFWRTLGAVTGQGPAVVGTSPSLPAGVGLPQGSDPAGIADPELRRQAEVLARRHAAAVSRASAAQLARLELIRLETVLRARGEDRDDDLERQLRAAMAEAPGLPGWLRRRLEQEP